MSINSSLTQCSTGKSMLMPVKGQRRFLEDLFPEVLKEAA